MVVSNTLLRKQSTSQKCQSLPFHLVTGRSNGWFLVSRTYLPMFCTIIYPTRWNERGTILWNSMTVTSFVFTDMANTMMYCGGVLYNLLFTECRHWVSQKEAWGRGSYITLFSPSDVIAFRRIRFISKLVHNLASALALRAPMIWNCTRTQYTRTIF